VLSRGNLKSVGQELGISYPTVSNKLEEVIQALQGETEERATELPTSVARRRVLQQIASGELPVEEGLKLLRKLKAEKERGEN